MALPLNGYSGNHEFLNLEVNKNIVTKIKSTLDFAKKLNNKIDDNNPLSGNMMIQC